MKIKEYSKFTDTLIFSNDGKKTNIEGLFFYNGGLVGMLESKYTHLFELTAYGRIHNDKAFSISVCCFDSFQMRKIKEHEFFNLFEYICQASEITKHNLTIEDILDFTEIEKYCLVIYYLVEFKNMVIRVKNFVVYLGVKDNEWSEVELNYSQFKNSDIYTETLSEIVNTNNPILIGSN